MTRLFTILCLALQIAFSHAGDLMVYPPVPGLDPSAHYQVRIRSTDKGAKWQSAFAWQTECKKEEAYFDTLEGWTHAYVNFETSGPVEIEISRINGQPIRSAAVHPERKASDCSVKDGKALVRLDKPCLVAVDIDGQMDGQDTGKGYKGPPLHTISLFANPPLAGKPSVDGPGVRTVKPGETPPSDGDWRTLYLLPGVHDIGAGFRVDANRQYYIPGDAMVYGSFCHPEWEDGHDIRIFGHGTLSGARLKHADAFKKLFSGNKKMSRKPIEILGAHDTQVEGLTIADSASHSVMLIHPYKEGHPNEVKWTKIFTWRANGDGINPFGNTLIEDCFIRTQDDSLYVNGLGIRRCVLWNDANGSSFVLSALPEHKLIVEDCDVIYSRAKWHHWSGGRVFNMRGEGESPAGTGVIFRNIRISDPRPTLQQFFICMTVPDPYGDGKRGAGDLSGILFQNISIAATSVIGEPQLLWGQSTERSLVILDEIGRGTSTFDGLSIAWSVAEHLHDHIGARCLFATHYHEITALAQSRSAVKNYNVAVKEWNQQIIFLRKILPGCAEKSYGIQVARLAGLPENVIARAKEVLQQLESGHQPAESVKEVPVATSVPAKTRKKAISDAEAGQMSLFG